MSRSDRPGVLPVPPFRAAPESARRLLTTQLAALTLPAVAGIAFFGRRAAVLLAASALTAALAELLCSRARQVRVPGSLPHSVMMGVLVAFMLPPTCPWFLAAVGAAAAVVLGKQFFGGLGHYVWHPALVGRLILELLSPGLDGQATGPILERGRLFWGDCLRHAGPVASWLRTNWFVDSPPGRDDAWLLPVPAEALRELHGLQFTDGVPLLGDYLWRRLPSLPHLLWGAVPGGVGETCTAALILVGLYFMYRGYVRWQLPLALVGGAYAAALVLPVVALPGQDGGPLLVFAPAADRAAALTYVHYHIFTGGLLLAAMVLAADMTPRPMSPAGQLIFGAGAGVLTIVLRLYTPLALPCYVALLVMNTLTAPLDAWLRRRGRSPGPPR